MFDAHKEGRERAAYERSGLDERWGVDRRDADAFIMTQAMHTEIAVSELKTILVFLGVGALAWAEGYHSFAWGVAGIGFMMTIAQELALKKRHASVSRLMDKGQD